MPHGGRRPNAGRKTNAQINSIRAILTETMSDAEWKELFHRLRELAYDGNMRAAQLLLTYRFGDPYAEPESDAPPINIRTIEVRLSEGPPHNSAPNLPAPTGSADTGDDDPEETIDESPSPEPPTMPAPRKSSEWAELDARYNTSKY